MKPLMQFLKINFMITTYATCRKHGDLTRKQVNIGGIMRSGNTQYRCKLCSRKEVKKNYSKYKTQLKNYHAKNKGKA